MQLCHTENSMFYFRIVTMMSEEDWYAAHTKKVLTDDQTANFLLIILD